METITATTPPLKYNIKLKLAGLTEPQRVNVGRKLRKRTGIGTATYSRYINARTNETTDIPGEILHHFAELLHCTVDDLYNRD